jgi:hypothetical protein
LKDIFGFSGFRGEQEKVRNDSSASVFDVVV